MIDGFLSYPLSIRKPNPKCGLCVGKILTLMSGQDCEGFCDSQITVWGKMISPDFQRSPKYSVPITGQVRSLYSFL